MLWQQLQEQTVELGWDFYLPVILFVVLVALAVPVWAAIGVAAISMLVMSGVLPLGLVGESLFHGIDHFALTAVPLFILTGDVLVRTGLIEEIPRRGRGADLLGQGRLWLGHGAGLRHVRRDLGLGRGGCCSGGPDDDRPSGRKRVSPPLCLRAGGRGRLYRHPDPAVDRVHHHRPCPGHCGLDPVPGRTHPRHPDPDLDPVHQYRHEPPERLGGRGHHDRSRMARQPVALDQDRLVRVPRARHHLLRHLFGLADADRSRAPWPLWSPSPSASSWAR